MPDLAGLEVLALAKEIGSTLQGTYVNNIYSFGESQLLRFRKPGEEDTWLVVSRRRGVWVSKNVAERAETQEFTSKLRGVLERARFVAASQVDLDRVFVLDFENEGRVKVIVELMPPGNIIVLDAEGRILQLLEEVRTPARRLVRGGTYSPPLQKRLSPLAVCPGDIKRSTLTEKTAGSAIGRSVALPRKYVAEALARMSLDDGSPSSSLLGREEELVRVLGQLVREAEGRPRGFLCETPAGDEIFVVQPHASRVKEETETVSELCDKLFLEETAAEGATLPPEEIKRRELAVTVSRLKAEEAALLAEASKARSAAKAAGTVPVEEAVRLLRESGILGSRQPNSSAAASSILFDRAKELEAKAGEARAAAERLERRAPKPRPKAPGATRPLSKRKTEWFEKFRWFMTSGGKIAVGGRDAQSNTLLVRRHLQDDDVVYHADLFGSPFFVLKGGKQQSELEVLELAQATVSFSSGWKTGLGAADAYWVFRDQVSPTAESGEYLAKGSFVVRGKKNFVRHAIIQVAVGLDKDGRVVAGPESAIARMCSKYVVLVPHREKPSDTAKKVLKELGLEGGKAFASNLDEVIRALPPGGGKIMRRKAGLNDSG